MASGFSEIEKTQLLALHGVGPTVIKRLEQIGLCSLADLSQVETRDVLDSIATLLNSTCWKNSPQSKTAISNAIDLAKQKT